MRTRRQWTVMVATVGCALAFCGTVGMAEDASTAEAVAAKAGKNLVANGSFEEGPVDRPTGWSFWVGAGQPRMGALPEGHTGPRGASIQGTRADYGVCFQNVKVTPNSSYRITLWYRYATQTSEPGAVRFGATSVTLAPGTTAWTQKSFRVQSGDKDTERLSILLYHRDNTLSFDDVEMIAE